MLGVVVWDAKEEEGNSHEDGNFGKQMFAGSAETIGQRGILTDLLVSSLSTHLVPTVVSYGEGDTAPGLHLHFLSS